MSLNTGSTVFVTENYVVECELVYILTENVVNECEWIYIREEEWNEYGITVVNWAATLVKPTVSPAGYNKLELDLDYLTECEQSKLARMARLFTFLAW